MDTEPTAAPESAQFVQYLFFKTDPQWRRLPEEVRHRGRREFAAVVAGAAPTVTTHAYSTLGLKVSSDLLLWWKSTAPESLQETLSALLQSGLGNIWRRQPRCSG